MCITLLVGISVYHCVIGTRRGQMRALDPCNWSYRQLKATVWVLGTKPRCFARVANVLNYQIIPQPYLLVSQLTLKNHDQVTGVLLLLSQQPVTKDHQYHGNTLSWKAWFLLYSVLIKRRTDKKWDKKNQVKLCAQWGRGMRCLNFLSVLWLWRENCILDIVIHIWYIYCLISEE